MTHNTQEKQDRFMNDYKEIATYNNVDGSTTEAQTLLDELAEFIK